MPDIPERLCRMVRDLDQLARLIDAIHAEAVEAMRDQGATWEQIGECYDPPKSRQAVARWMLHRRRASG